MKTVKCPHDHCSAVYPDEYACILCGTTGEVSTELAVEYALLDLNAIYNWDVWRYRVHKLLAGHKHEDS